VGTIESALIWSGAVEGPAPDQMSADSMVPTSGTAGDIYSDANATLEGLSEAQQAADDGDDAEAKDLQKQALKDLADFYESYGD